MRDDLAEQLVEENLTLADVPVARAWAWLAKAGRGALVLVSVSVLLFTGFAIGTAAQVLWCHSAPGTCTEPP